MPWGKSSLNADVCANDVCVFFNPKWLRPLELNGVCVIQVTDSACKILWHFMFISHKIKLNFMLEYNLFEIAGLSSGGFICTSDPPEGNGSEKTSAFSFK